jgi:hypothetical protein
MESIMKVPWTCEEMAIALIFSSWGFDYEVVGCLLTNRMTQLHYVGANHSVARQRSAEAVQKKLARVRKDNPELQLPLDRGTVARFVTNLQADHTLINRLLDFTDQDISSILDVSLLKPNCELF